MPTPASVPVGSGWIKLELPSGWTFAFDEPLNLDELCTQIMAFGHAGWCFRGEPRLWLTHLTSLGRHLAAIKKPSIALEHTMVSVFRHHAHAHLAAYESTFMESVFSTLVLMQHHGAPTRLLDWTRSVWVAAYFACCKKNDEQEPGFVWAFDPGALKHAMSPEQSATALRILGIKSAAEYRDTLSPLTTPLVFAPGTIEATPRMVAQQGEFTWAHPVNADHVELIGRLLPTSARSVLVIPSRFKSDLMKRLTQMNCASSSLFPGLDGAGRFLAEAVDWGLPVPGMP